MQQTKCFFNFPAVFVDSSHTRTGERSIIGDEELLTVSGNGDLESTIDVAALNPVGIAMNSANLHVIQLAVALDLRDEFPLVRVDPLEDFLGSVKGVKQYIRGL